MLWYAVERLLVGCVETHCGLVYSDNRAKEPVSRQ